MSSFDLENDLIGKLHTQVYCGCQPHNRPSSFRTIFTNLHKAEYGSESCCPCLEALQTMWSLESRGKICTFWESDPNDRVKTRETEKGKDGPGAGRYTAEERHMS